jgi:hypothetical protein
MKYIQAYHFQLAFVGSAASHTVDNIHAFHKLSLQRQ